MQYSILGTISFGSMAVLSSCTPAMQDKPNILICISDDQSFPHTSAYGSKWINTPNFDRVARDGILFTNAYTPNAKSSPSRACIITGRNSWQLEAAANHVPYFPERFKSYAEVLSENGYHTGYVAKGWAPGDPGIKDGEKRQLLGPSFSRIKTVPPTGEISDVDYAENFKAFLDSNTTSKPFCFWFGSIEPHREYEYGSGIKKGGKKTEAIPDVFDFWPDNDTVRNDMLDYAYEIEYFDKQLGKMLRILEEKGLLENTLVVVTSDNGMPFPRAKGQTYEISNHLPLAMMWPKGIKRAGRIFKGLVSFTDFAPTFLEIADVSPGENGMEEMEGESLLPVLKDIPEATGREFMLIGRERNDVGRPDDQGYPVRGIVKDGFLYLRNFKPERWPACNPETGYMDSDGCPTKSLILNLRRKYGSSIYWDYAYAKRSHEELYKIVDDPECLINLADDNNYLETKTMLSGIMIDELKKEEDPRILGNGDIFDKYPYSEVGMRNYYNRIMDGEKLSANWINQNDIEKKKIE